MYRQVILPDGSTGFFRDAHQPVQQASQQPVQQPVQQPSHQQKSISTSPTSRELLYVQQRFQSPQATYEQHHARITEVPQSNHLNPNASNFEPNTYGSNFIPRITSTQTAANLHQSSPRQMISYDPAANQEFPKVKEEQRSPSSQDDKSMQKKLVYGNIRSKTRRELLAMMLENCTGNPSHTIA